LLPSTWGGFRNKILTVALAMFGSGVGMLLVGIAPQNALMLVVGGMLVAGMMNVLINGPSMALLQTIVQADMQGRVMSLVISLASSMAPLSLALAGPLAEFTGVRSWFVLTSLVFALSGVFTLVNPDVRNIDKGSRVPVLEQDAPVPAVAKNS